MTALQPLPQTDPMRTLAISLALASVLTACGAEDESAAACMSVDDSLLQALAQGSDVTAMTPVDGGAVKSPDFEDVYFVAMKFDAAGAEGTVGVWATNSLSSGGGSIFAADAFAQEFTDWPDGDTGPGQISLADPSIDDARSCVS